jgi:hypothetical protein
MNGPSIKYEQNEQEIAFFVPEQLLQDIDTIIVIDIEGQASEIAPVDMHKGPLTPKKTATASSYYVNRPSNPTPWNDENSFKPGQAVDGNWWSRWSASAQDKTPWLEIDLGEIVTFDRVMIQEAFDCVQEFDLQYKDGKQWQTVVRGTKIGDEYLNEFQPVIARYIRLNILKVNGPLSVREIEFYKR